MNKIQERLDNYYTIVQSVILSRQNPVTGLIPASVAVTSHGDYRDAWVRDCVYSIYAVFGLALAYRRLDDDQGKRYELEHSVVKLMRGLLMCMMRQASKVEQFKNTQSLAHALHAKYNTKTCDAVVGDSEWGHLQMDATSLFLLALAQMTSAGFRIIYNHDEVDFVQNLVFYIERAYRTPDYGIWERGNKINHGMVELNASSIGMVVSAMRAIKDLNLFGSQGGPSSVIHVLPDEFTRNYTTLCAMLPRESNSKEVDAALLSVISFPAFAVSEQGIIRRTKEEVTSKLEGKYGCKRFLRDGHQTVVEDTSRLHYDPCELSVFEGIECEWPLFYCYLLLDGLFNEDAKQVEEYRQKIANIIVETNVCASPRSTDERLTLSPSLSSVYSVNEAEPLCTAIGLIPELYIVPENAIKSEKEKPHSQKRIPNENVPLVWAQSLYILSNLLYEKLLSPDEIDALSLRTNSHEPMNVVVQVVLIAETEDLKHKLGMFGLDTQTVEQVSPVSILPPSALREAYSNLGVNQKLGLSGRPKRPIGTLGTCKMYRFNGSVYAFTPHFMDNEEFYLTSDNDYLISVFEQELAFIQQNWFYNGRPTMIIRLTNAMMDDLLSPKPRSPSTPFQSTSRVGSKRNLFNFMASLKTGKCAGVRVRVGRLSEMMNTCCIESLDFLNQEVGEARLKSSRTYSKAKKLLLSEKATQDGQRRPGSRRGSNHGTIYTPSTPQFKLKEHSYSPRQRRNPAEVVDGFLALSLGDPAYVTHAVSHLLTSYNLYDQIDFLHYLVSCHGLDFIVPGINSNCKELLEEVYMKAIQLKLWTIVRQSAGLLNKVVNSLTINVTDFVIRLKQLTIGSGSMEFSISAPLSPDKLMKEIYQHCKTDVREAPFVQEVLIYLGSLIRSTPSLFDGILRVRTHFLIMALREEVMRITGCSRSEAHERMMQMSPFETKTLLKSILSNQDTAKSLKPRVFPDLVVEDGEISTFPSTPSCRTLTLQVQAAAFSSGNFAYIQINGVKMDCNQRGLHIVIIKPNEGTVSDIVAFDTHASFEESEELVTLLEGLEIGDIVVGAMKDEMSEHLTPAASASLEALGCRFPSQLKYRDSWCFIGEKGFSKGSAVETYRKNGDGPTDMLQRVIEVGFKNVEQTRGGLLARRRHNDGAVNRVPPNFYRNVWRVLEGCKRIVFLGQSLDRAPTIFEKTPEELNFALLVESLLDAAREPAERQLAVETLVVTARIQGKNPELKFDEISIDVSKLIDVAIGLFWTKTNSVTIDSGTLNEADIRALFYDLPREGKEGTMAYLANAVLKTLPYEVNLGKGECTMS